MGLPVNQLNYCDSRRTVNTIQSHHGGGLQMLCGFMRTSGRKCIAAEDCSRGGENPKVESADNAEVALQNLQTDTATVRPR